MNKNKLIAYGRNITNSGIYTGNGTTSNVEDFDKANRSSLVESYIDNVVHQIQIDNSQIVISNDNLFVTATMNVNIDIP